MTRYRFIFQEKASLSVTRLCELLEVSTSAYYDWLARPEPPQPPEDDARLRLHLRVLHKQSRGTYGRPRLTAALRAQGFVVNHKRVARLMHEEGLVGCPQRRFKKTTQTDADATFADNLLERQFSPQAPDQVWAGDITYIEVTGGFVYLAVLIDLFSRRVVGFCVDNHVRTELVEETLMRAASVRSVSPGWMHHSDRGCQYTSHRYQARLRSMDAVVSMSRKGNCWDNAPVESFFGTIKQELLHQQTWRGLREVRAVVSDYIHNFYNPVRIHAHNHYVSPVQAELDFNQQLRVA